jgi:NAD(P)-dependent dehydrogenase (short-subunit alcohol dehydrogenase family)
VSSYEAVEALADKAFAEFGAVHVLCNNAGVSGQERRIWEASVQDWQWIAGVNLFGVAYGIRAFVPRMLEGGEEGHIVNTSSVFGLHSFGGADIYSATKHAVLRMTEGLHYELREAGSRIHVSVLCPGMIATNILNAERNRPSDLKNKLDQAQAAQQAEQRAQLVRRFQEEGMPPSEVAEMVVDAIRNERFYILTHPGVKENVRKRMEDILEDRVPEPMALVM